MTKDEIETLLLKFYHYQMNECNGLLREENISIYLDTLEPLNIKEKDHACERCRHYDNVEHRTDPYDSEIERDRTFHYLCKEYYNKISQEI